MHTPPGGELPLVGRTDELAVVVAAIADAGHRRTTVLHVIGDAGLGKSRLLVEACRLASDQGAEVLTGAAGDAAGLTPFALVRSIIERAQEARGNRSLERYLGVPSDDVALMLGSSDQPARLRQWRDVMRRAMTNLSARGPVLLALDDVHWADDQSLDVISSLARRPPPAGFVLLLGYRSGPEMSRLLAGSGPEVASTPAFSVRRLELDALGRDEIATLFPDAGPAWQRSLLDASGGNPFFVEALQRHTDLAVGTPDEAGNVPPALRHTLAAEVESLPPEARRVVQLAAVLGPIFDPHVLADAADQSFDATLTALDQARAHGICSPGDLGTRWRFRHPLLRLAVYQEQPSATRTAAHRCIEEALASHGARPAQRARHVAAFARPGDATAARLLVSAASDVVDQSPISAERWLSTALSLHPTAGVDDVRDVRMVRCRANTARGELLEARAEAHDVAGAFDLGDERRVDAVRFAAHLDQLLGRFAESDAMLTRELASRPTDADDTDLDAALLLDLATTRLMHGDFEGARGPAEQAVAFAASSHRTTPPGLLAGAWSLHALVAMADGDHERAVADRTTATRSVDALTDSELAEHLEAGLWLGWVEMFHEQYAEGLKHLCRCLDIARRGTHQHLMTYLLVGYGSLLKLRGDLPAAAEAFDEAAEIAGETHSAELIGMAAAMQCRVATWLGDHDRACRLGERAVQETSEPESWFDTVARATLAQAHLAAGDVSTVEVDLLVAGGGHLLPRFDPATRCDWWEVLTRAALGREDAPDIRSAAHYAELATRTADELPLQSPQAAAALANAHVAAAQERWSVAAAAAMDAADGFAVVGNRLEQGRALLTAGTSYAAGGSRRDGLDVLRLADAAFAECSAAHLQAQTRASMRRLGVRLPRQGRRAPAAELTPDPADDAATQRSLAVLSRREQEVADLVRAGRTNRQIAADLVVSEKTVESHLSHIFTKLGVGSRAAVASAVERSRAGPRRPAP